MSTRREFLRQTAAAGAIAAAAMRSSLLHARNAASVKTPLKTYTVPQTGLVVSRISYGNAMIGLDSKSPDFVSRTLAALRTAYEHGITFFDTADVSAGGLSETAIGDWLKQSPGLRNRIVIQSKAGHGRAGALDNSREHIVRAVEGSLKRLGTDHLDILLLHWPDSLVEPQGVAEAFDRLLDSGKVRYFGVSNHSPYQIELLRKHVRQPLVANQIRLGLAHWYAMPEPNKGAITHDENGAETVDYCRLHNIQVQAYSPLRAGSHGQRQNLLKQEADAPAAVKETAQALAEIAEEKGVSPAAIMLAWLLHHPAGIVPVIGATKIEHIVDNCTADGVRLTREEWYRLLRAAAKLHVA